MKAFVLMNKRTGDLWVGYRVTFMDQMEAMVSSDTWNTAVAETNSEEVVEEAPPAWSVGFLKQDGWLVQHPKMCGEFALFFNMKSSKFFENLGEL